MAPDFIRGMEQLMGSNFSSLAASNSKQVPTVASSVQTKTWSSLLNSSSGSKLRYFEPTVHDGKKRVYISKDIHDLGLAFWENCLVGQFFVPPIKSLLFKHQSIICGDVGVELMLLSWETMDFFLNLSVEIPRLRF